jgi:hypothetical protein
LETPGFSEDWSPVFRADRVQNFTAASGVDPKHVSEAWIAGYDLGQLYLFDAKTTGTAAAEAFQARALTTKIKDTGYANLVHITGMIEQTPHALIQINDHLVAIAVGDIRLARIVQAYAEGKLKKSPAALASRFLKPHASFEEGAPLRAFVLGPYESATDAVTNAFVSGCVAIGVKEHRLDVRAQAWGLWPAGAALDESLTSWTDQVLSTREFRALGWGFPLNPPTVKCTPQPDLDVTECNAQGVWSSPAIAKALYRITAASMAELMEAPPSGWTSEATTRPRHETTNSEKQGDEPRKENSSPPLQ